MSVELKAGDICEVLAGYDIRQPSRIVQVMGVDSENSRNSESGVTYFCRYAAPNAIPGTYSFPSESLLRIETAPAKPTQGGVEPEPNSAPALLGAAAKHMRDRAATYDKPGGERSMGKAVEAFNVITGRDLSESEGWLLMQILKDVRDRQRSAAHTDSLEDCIAYAALKAEARIAGK